MTDLASLKNGAEAELLGARDSGHLDDLRARIADWPPALRAAYGPVLVALGSPPLSEEGGVRGLPGASERQGACRLALLAMYVDTGTPRWSSGMLDKVLDAVLAVPGGTCDDFLLALWRMCDVPSFPLTVVGVRFIRDVVRALLTRQRRGMPVDLRWLTPLGTGLTPARACFSYLVLALKPEWFTDALEQSFRGALKDPEVLEEVFPPGP
ncbi:hypothetical protein HUA74_34990 [Myxococcus sp. CA051A]|uniref:hypothetical protein n=1 Tax=Myxococcus sp. CA051A TaxID=2741739 RepID=UPI00157AFF72|nr:hypothetical protein [Myxococcus sp. CA051A]NTX65879.1 hypothetical protein [Myxococcus sp. CA051A]